ncbi:CcdB family protein [Azospirillum sp.]|uniref:CcdB family protein n=1 Tax=Azospirillum sp. TaxID=34012 RepID=UPI002D5E849C|nr:CcdB family protein [Azospirillum sp.]HYD68475.1 CcdB family protein [Azospirillum sp.]
MRFLDVCRNPDADERPKHPVPYLLVVQGNHVAVRSSRVVVPLVRQVEAGPPIRDLMPVVEVDGEALVAMTPQIAGVPVSDIGPVVANVADAHHAIRRAIDVLTGDL